MNKATDPADKRIRLTISVTPEVHEVFSRLAAGTSTSIGRTMGDWLGDTIDAATHTANLVEQARAAPRQVAMELHAYALGMQEETGALLATIRRDKGLMPDAQRPASGSAGVVPPRHVIRGVKSSTPANSAVRKKP